MTPNIVVIAHDIRSCYNVGSLLRTCEGLGIHELFLTGHTPYPKAENDERLPHEAAKVDRQIEKTALGAQDSQNWQHEQDITALLDRLRSEGYKICALEQEDGSIPINLFKPPDKVALILGNEVKGLEKKILSVADFILEIPMYGKKESFNVIQAAAMALYAFRFISK